MNTLESSTLLAYLTQRCKARKERSLISCVSLRLCVRIQFARQPLGELHDFATIAGVKRLKYLFVYVFGYDVD